MGGKSSPEYHARYFQTHKEQFAEYRRRHRERNPNRTAEHRKARLSNYHLSTEQYEELKRQQANVCAVCGGVDQGCELSVDHDHSCCEGQRSCGKCIRGLLCKRCNSILGLARDQEELLLQLVQYLRRTKKDAS